MPSPTTHHERSWRRGLPGWSAPLCAVIVFGAGFSSACNTHIVDTREGPITQPKIIISSDEVEMDILWVVDNSGSMCQEQKALRDNFNAFVDTIEDASLDFHIAVTTTHAPGEDSSYAQEPVAVEGHIQSIPQPIPGTDDACIGTFVEAERGYSDFNPLRGALALAVECMIEPDRALLEVTDEELNCAMADGARPGCEGVGNDRDGDDVFTLLDVFPRPTQYRSIPKVLRAQDYSEGGALDVDQLRADFACMSLVGTRGDGYEKGLQAAVEAVSPALTGLVQESPSADGNAPNFGFLRKNASFTAIFVTDENDCSHDGGIAESEQTCGGSICDYENAADLRGEPSDLTGIPELADRLRRNLSDSKGRAVGDSEILIASIHGLWAPFEGDVPSCSEPREELPDVPIACRNEDLGVAFSGDRYDRFMRQFPNYYPNAVTGGSEEKRLNFEEFQEFGEMCTGDFSASLRAIGEFIGRSGDVCIVDPLSPCEDSEECPAPLFGDAAPACVSGLTSGGLGFCDTEIILRMIQGEGSLPIEENGYCIPDSINAMRTERPSCVIDPSFYQWVTCPASGSALSFEWTRDTQAEFTRRFDGYDVEILYKPAGSF